MNPRPIPYAELPPGSFDPMMCEMKMDYRPKVRPSELPKIASSQDAAEYMRDVFNKRSNIEMNEEFYVMPLNRANKILGWYMVSQGGQAGTVVDIKRVMQCAYLSNCASIVLCHNHPSGNSKPSEADIKLTKRIKDACLTSDIAVLDHVILTSDSYYSFADEGMM